MVAFILHSNRLSARSIANRAMASPSPPASDFEPRADEFKREARSTGMSRAEKVANATPCRCCIRLNASGAVLRRGEHGAKNVRSAGTTGVPFRWPDVRMVVEMTSVRGALLILLRPAKPGGLRPLGFCCADRRGSIPLSSTPGAASVARGRAASAPRSIPRAARTGDR